MFDGFFRNIFSSSRKKKRKGSRKNRSSSRRSSTKSSSHSKSNDRKTSKKDKDINNNSSSARLSKKHRSSSRATNENVQGRTKSVISSTTNNNQITRRTNSLPNHGKNKSTKNQIETPDISTKIKQQPKLLVPTSPVSSSKRKVSTWLTNYGLKQHETSIEGNNNNNVGRQGPSPINRVDHGPTNKYGAQQRQNYIPPLLQQQQQQHHFQSIVCNDGPNKVKSGSMLLNNMDDSKQWWPKQQLARATSSMFNGGGQHQIFTTSVVGKSFGLGGGGERVGWEYHNITLSRVPVYGFGIAVSGGRDNPHFMNGDPSIAISDVLKAGPAEGKLLVNDRVISANGISLENVDYSQAIHVLRECGNSVNLLIKRRALISPSNANQSTSSDPNNNLVKVTLTKNNKKDDLGIVLGCKIYVKEIVNRNSNNDKENNLQVGDIIDKINNTNAENLTLKEAKKLLDNCKDKITIVVRRDLINQNFLNENGNYINGHSRSNSSISNVFRPKWPPNGYEVTGPNNSNNNNINNNNWNNEPNFPNNASTVSLQSNNNFNSNIAVMTNSRVNNGWSNQNLYVQPPTRNETATSLLNGTANQINDAGRSREPSKDLSLGHIDQQAETSNNLDSSATSKLSHRPLPKKPNSGEPCELPNISDNNNNSLNANDNNEALVDQELISRNTKSSEMRYIAFQKEGSVGIRLTGGNEVGIFVTAVQPGSPAYQQGLQVGDKILKANNVEMKDFTREEAVLYLLRIKDRIELYVQNCKEEYENIVAKQKGDSFYIRVHFNYDSEGKGELSFHVGDVFHVVDTLFNGVVGSWFVYRLGRNNQEIQKGSIPNKTRADELAAEQRLENRSKKSDSGSDLNMTEASSKRGNFFKRRRAARRSKSLCKEHWEDILFGDSNSKFTAYERVSFKHPGFVRPIIFFGPLADIAREKLIRDYPDKFESPQSLMMNEETKNSKLNNSGIVRLSAIKEIIDREKHALLDIAPSAVDRLNYAQFYPIVIFIRVENKSIVKELRNRSSTKSTVHRSSRKLFEQSIKLEKVWHHIFTSSITLTSGGDLWYKKLRETIDKQQVQNIWMSEFKPDESISDDFLFPMNSISRLSYASSPESDLDISMNESKTDNENDKDDDFMQNSNNISNGRLAKASSDPSLAPQVEQQTNKINGPTEMTSFGSPNKTKDQKTKQDLEMSTTNKQIPLHILLKKELSKNFSEKLDMEDNKTINQMENNISEYPTLKIGERISTCPNNDEVYESRVVTITNESPLPPPPASSLSNSKIQPQYLEPPPRIDRNSKPSRFRSAHERLFGLGSAKITNNVPNQMDDSDYINCTALEYSDKSSLQTSQKVNFGDNSSHNSNDSFNKYGANSTLDSNKGSLSRVPNGTSHLNDPYRFTRSTAQPVPHNLSKSDMSKSLPPPLPPVKMEPPFSKKPPSPPPKPKLNNQSLQYQMNSTSLNDNGPPFAPRKPYLSSNNIYDKQQFSDYDNMPPLNYPLKVPPKMGYQGNSLEMSNGPPGYYQSLPQSSYGFQQPLPPPKEQIHQRYSSHAETISNFINGTTYNNIEINPNNFNSMSKPSMQFMSNGDLIAHPMSKVPSQTFIDHNNMQKYNMSSNYDNIRYAGQTTSGLYMNSINDNYNNNSTYLNLPFNCRPFENSMNYLNEHNGQPSPLPPPPPLPSYSQARSNNVTPSIVQPTPQPARSGQYLDLSLNRENRGSAFEVYRKPAIEPTSGSPMFQGLPPPPPPLPVNDFNHVNYTNIEEINSTSSSLRQYSQMNGMGMATGNSKSMDSIESVNSNVIATARGVFGSEGGSLVSAETGVSIIIPPNAIPDGVSQEIYFKVCEDKKLAPPLDRDKGETMLSPIVMCGPHGLRFNIPIELRLPHCAIVNPESWSFALKSSDTNNGEPAGWRNISINNNQVDGINNFNEQFVSVLVDHF